MVSLISPHLHYLHCLWFPLSIQCPADFSVLEPIRHSVTLRGLIRDEQTNAIIGWLLTDIIVLGTIKIVLTVMLLWGRFELVIIATTLM